MLIVLFWLCTLAVIRKGEITPTPEDAWPQDLSNLQFQDPILADSILKELDRLAMKSDSFKSDLGLEMATQPFANVKADPEYCNKHRTYWTQNPHYVFTENNYMTDYAPTKFIKEYALNTFATDVMPETAMPRSNSPASWVDIKPEVGLIITFQTMFYRRLVMKHFSCLGQMSNHIPQHNILYERDRMALAARRYAKSYENRKECLKEFIPTTYVLADEQHCKGFFTLLNSTKYQNLKKEKDIVFISKIANVHQGAGVALINEAEEEKLKIVYKNGAECGKIPERKLVQSFIHNPLLINGKKTDFRVYMLVASTNPLIVFYADGYLRNSLTDYDLKSTKKSAFATNTALIESDLNEMKANASNSSKTHEEILKQHTWIFSDFQTYLLEKGIVNDTNWLDNYLRKELKKAAIHLMRMTQHKFLKISSVFELFALDFMLDENLNLWFLEANVRPGFVAWTEDYNRVESQMLKDQFDIIFRLLRSRMKRIFQFVSNIIRRGDGKLVLQDLEKHVQEFKMISENKFEPEYEPRANSTFAKIIDENYFGSERYSGLLSEQCL